jgi:uncharacterized membrane protein YphA (DoxX/SURF4 family)
MLGVVHYLYPDAVANFIPKWIPAHLFWAYFTGVAFWAAGLAILSGVLARLASRLLAMMLSSWVPILHIPLVVAAVAIGTNGTQSSLQSPRPGLLGSWRVVLRDCSSYWTPP